MQRLRFALIYAGRHALLSASVACATAVLVFGLIYPEPFRSMLGVSGVFVLIMGVDVVCGPLLTLILANPRKSVRERWMDFSLIGLIQIAALTYGLYSVWAGRPVILAFEVDRLVVATANEIQLDELPQALDGMRSLPWWGVHQVNTRRPKGGDEFLNSLDIELQGISPAMRPDWWLPWDTAKTGIKERALPIVHLLERHAEDAVVLKEKILKTGLPVASLRYIPLVSSKTSSWIALFDENLNLVGYLPIDGF